MKDARQRLLEDLRRAYPALDTGGACAALSRVALCYFETAELLTATPDDPTNRLAIVSRLLAEHVDATEGQVAALRAELAQSRRRGLSVVDGGLASGLPRDVDEYERANNKPAPDAALTEGS